MALSFTIGTCKQFFVKYHKSREIQVKILITGKMKTYWLLEHENRPSVKPKNFDIFLENIEPSYIFSPRGSSSADGINQVDKDKRMYSPITFHDVRARSSVSEIPVNNNLNKVKGNFTLLLLEIHVPILMYLFDITVHSATHTLLNGQKY